MRSRLSIVRFIGAVIVLLGLLGIVPAVAQPAPPTPALPEGMTSSEFQSLGCMGGGVVVALGALTYVEIIAAAAAVGASATLIAPLLATGFVVGCSVGSAMVPGLWWIYRQF